MAEDFAAKMSRKTVAELRDYVDNRYQYREEAVLAALEELDRRGTPEPAAATIMQELQISQQETARRESVARAQEEEREQARRRIRGEEVPAEVADETGPVLYSPSTITVFSVLFSMVAGGVLLALNLRTLRRFGLSWLVLLLALGYWVGAQYSMKWILENYGTQYFWLGSVFNILAIVLYNLFVWPRFIGLQPYRSRPWGGALLVCALIMMVFAILYLRFGVSPAV
ncbi:hypothetical protein HNQ93_002991 [Hymenobacter luteus]|uniref:Uncharacterized protein n=2 Tax=Hymenobacter TaxID=89966 RepID=A0A7W9WD29_9BACT|nr:MULTISPECIES: hypothetical protein [Hymenobacter]MBB4603227.1 hypothetical protein [Hymenobacter latericoloratus]MBB6060125.1 hypothetical protein [Hymenobacter luteus]